MILQDLRHAVRLFARHRAVAAVAVLSLALATGPNAALFGLIDGLFFRRLPVGNPEQLIGLKAMKNARGEAITYADWLDIRRETVSLDGPAAWERVALPVSIASQRELLTGNLVSADYFIMLGVKPMIGRLFSPQMDEQPQAESPLVISYSYWKRRFGGAPDAVGTLARLMGRNFIIVGVAPRGFRGLDVQFPVEGWIPLSAGESTGQLEPGTFADREHGRLEAVLGRTRPGATLSQVRADMERISRVLGQAYPATNQSRTFRAYSFIHDRTSLGLTAGAFVIGLVSLVLLVACANVAGLLLSLAEARRGEVAVRLALGASRWRLVRQFLVESMLLWLAATILGLLFAGWLMRLPISLPVRGVVLDYDIHFDATVYLFTILLAFVTSVSFGLAPALQATKADLITGLNSVRGTSNRRHGGMRRVLVGGQVAVSQFLLAGAVLVLRSYLNVREVRPGFDPQRKVLVAALASDGSSGVPTTPARREALVERLRALPGVVDVSAAASIPLSGSGDGAMQTTGWTGNAADVPIRSNFIRPRYFSVMGIRLLRGRDFDAREIDAHSNNVIVNETLARLIAPDGAVLDRWIRVQGVLRQVVGVAEDGRYGSLRDQPEPYLYLPSSAPGLILLETSGDPAGLIGAVHKAVAQVTPDLYVADISTLGDATRFAHYADLVGMELVGSLGALAMFLTAVGVFGMVSHWVTSRTREFGVRMALGAERRHVLRLVLVQGLRLTVVGAALGMVAAVVGGLVLSSVLFGVSPADPRSYAIGGAVVAAVVALACLGPARRASSVAPATALRYE
jgi:putative ABC transport system permease protein